MPLHRFLLLSFPFTMETHSYSVPSAIETPLSVIISRTCLLVSPNYEFWPISCFKSTPHHFSDSSPNGLPSRLRHRTAIISATEVYVLRFIPGNIPRRLICCVKVSGQENHSHFDDFISLPDHYESGTY